MYISMYFMDLQVSLIALYCMSVVQDMPIISLIKKIHRHFKFLILYYKCLITRSNRCF